MHELILKNGCDSVIVLDVVMLIVGLTTHFSSVDPSGSKQEVVLQLHFIIIIAVLGLLAVLIALDMICFCSINRGILAMICGGISSDKELKKQEFVPLSGGFE